MVPPSRVERLWPRRLRWRLKGAWLWPAFLLLTPLEGVLLTRLPFYGTSGPGTLVAGLLLAGFMNLALVALVTPFAARLLRRRRQDLPRVVAADTAGTGLMAAAFVAIVVGGLLHRPEITAERDDRAAQLAAVHDYVLAQAPEYRRGLGAVDAMRVEEDMYRSCVPGPDPRRWLCLFVQTDQRPPGVALDGDRVPNAQYRRHGGFD